MIFLSIIVYENKDHYKKTVQNTCFLKWQSENCEPNLIVAGQTALRVHISYGSNLFLPFWLWGYSMEDQDDFVNGIRILEMWFHSC